MRINECFDSKMDSVQQSAALPWFTARNIYRKFLNWLGQSWNRMGNYSDRLLFCRKRFELAASNKRRHIKREYLELQHSICDSLSEKKKDFY